VNRLSAFIRSLPPAVEFGIVALTAFALPVVGSLMQAADPPAEPLYDPAGLRDLVIWEVLVMLVLGWFLMMRGWDFARQPLYPSWIECGLGLTLACGILLGWSLLWPVIQFVLPPQDVVEAPFAPGLDWPTLIAACIVNPVFEEWLVCAYIISAIRRPLGLGLAIAVSVSIRAAYHTYQGPVGFIYAFAIGLIFAIWFVRTRQLWPLVVAHGALDFIGLLDSALA